MIKRTNKIIMVMALFFLTIPINIHAEELPLSQSERDTINDEVDDVFKNIEKAQEKWAKKKRGERYIQLKEPYTVSNYDDGNTISADRLVLTDNGADLSIIGLDENEEYKADYAIDQYKIKDEPGNEFVSTGFVMRALVEISGDIWYREKNHGPRQVAGPDGHDKWSKRE
jgi:hypothetical protein